MNLFLLITDKMMHLQVYIQCDILIQVIKFILNLGVNINE